MSGIYGSFYSDKEHPLHKKYFSRVDSLYFIAKKSLDLIIKDCPALENHLSISYSNIQLAVGRYFNDIIRIKALHDIDIVHRSKILSLSLKWMSLTPAIVTHISKDELKELDYSEKIHLYNPNNYIITLLISYYYKGTINIKKGDPVNQRFFHIVKELSYYIKTGNYNEHVAYLLFYHISLT